MEIPFWCRINGVSHLDMILYMYQAAAMLWIYFVHHCISQCLQTPKLQMQLSQYLLTGLPKYGSACDSMLGDNSVLVILFGQILIHLHFIYMTAVHYKYIHFVAYIYGTIQNIFKYF